MGYELATPPGSRSCYVDSSWLFTSVQYELEQIEDRLDLEMGDSLFINMYLVTDAD